MTNKFEELVKLSPQGIYDYATNMVKVNKKNAEKNIPGIAFCITGHAGIGKTSIASQVAKDQNMSFVKLNLAQMSEACELSGFPVVEYELSDNRWLPEANINDSLRPLMTGRTRQGTAVPDWMPQDGKPVFLLLDDFTRAPSYLMQAIMEICDLQSYISWSLPKGSTVALTSNPAGDKDYMGVQNLGAAQTSRTFEIGIEFNIEDWSIWATKAGIDHRCIVFANHCKEVMESKAINPRLVTKFFLAVGAIEGDWGTRENRQVIQSIGASSIKAEYMAMFTAFLDRRLDKLPKPEEFFSVKGDQLTNLVHDTFLAVDLSQKTDSEGNITAVPKESVIALMTKRITDYLIVKYEDQEISTDDVNTLEHMNELKIDNMKIIGEDVWANFLKKVSKKANFLPLNNGKLYQNI